MKTVPEIVLDFISHFKGSERVFLHGCCYWFARILFERFDNEFGADIRYEPVQGHFVTQIATRFYDVCGDVTEKYRGKPMYYLADLRKEDSSYYRHLMRDCRDFKEEDEYV